MNVAFARLARGGGFEPSRLAFTLRTALGAGLALLLAGALGLDHPQWSAMTVWIAAQPLRGQLLEKSLFRLLGSALGIAYGVALVAASGGAPVAVVPGLALWVGLCAGAGQLLRGFVSYGTLLAGYSAAMVALLDAAHPEHIVALGWDRLLTIAIGVGVAVLTSLRFAAPSDIGAAEVHIRDLAGRRLRELAAWARGQDAPREAVRHGHLSVLAQVEDGLDLQAAGSMQARRRLRALRLALSAQVGLLLWWPHAAAAGATRAPALADALDAAAQAHERGEATTLPLRHATGLATGHPHLAEVLRCMADAAAAMHATREGASADAAPMRAVVLHRNWAAAREALLRTAAALLLVGSLWLATGWHAAPLLMLGVAVMTTLFSTAEDPARLMQSIFCGQLLGATAALLVQALLWPLAEGPAARLLLCLPLIAVGAFVLAHPRSARFGFDYNLVGLLLLQPMHPPPFVLGTAVAEMASVAAAPLVALLAYRWIFPASGRRRFTQLVLQMRGEVAAMAAMAARPDALAAHESPEAHDIWRARLQHRLLRLVRWAEQAGHPPGRATREAVGVLETGETVRALQRALADEGLEPAIRHRADLLLRRLARAPQEADRRPLARALARAARHPGLARVLDAAQLRRAAFAVEGTCPGAAASPSAAPGPAADSRIGPLGAAAAK